MTRTIKAAAPIEVGTRYGLAFDLLADRWAAIEAEHDRQHPDRGDCGGVGRCSMMFAAVTLQQEMIEKLTDWRVHR